MGDVDVCDTATHPDTIGIRGSMPGTGDRQEQMYMRFVVEYRSPTGHWHYLKDGESALVAVGNGASKARQAGQDFQVARSATPDLHAARRGRVRVACERTHDRPGRARDARRAHRGRRRRPARLQRRDLHDHAKSRGSFVITPRHAERREARDLGRVVDRPRVDLAAGVAHRVDQRRRDDRPVRHERVDRAGADSRGGAPR